MTSEDDVVVVVAANGDVEVEADKKNGNGGGGPSFRHGVVRIVALGDKKEETCHLRRA